MRTGPITSFLVAPEGAGATDGFPGTLSTAAGTGPTRLGVKNGDLPKKLRIYFPAEKAADYSNPFAVLTANAQVCGGRSRGWLAQLGCDTGSAGHAVARQQQRPLGLGQGIHPFTLGPQVLGGRRMPGPRQEREEGVLHGTCSLRARRRAQARR